MPEKIFFPIFAETVVWTRCSLTRASEHHWWDHRRDHVGQWSRRGGTDVWLGQQKHWCLHPQETRELLSKTVQAAIHTHIHTHRVIKTWPLFLVTFFFFFFLLNQRLMSDLEEKEKHLNKLKMKVDNLLVNNHPASDKIEVSACFSFFLSFLHRIICLYRCTCPP